MSLSLVRSRALVGLAAERVTVEVHLANGLPSFTLVGLAETEVKEARWSSLTKCRVPGPKSATCAEPLPSGLMTKCRSSGPVERTDNKVPTWPDCKQRQPELRRRQRL